MDESVRFRVRPVQTKYPFFFLTCFLFVSSRNDQQSAIRSTQNHSFLPRLSNARATRERSSHIRKGGLLVQELRHCDIDTLALITSGILHIEISTTLTDCFHSVSKGRHEYTMAFRKRNLAVGRQAPESATLSGPITHLPKGMKPSSLSSHSITSTGCASLDSLFGGHGGLALGSSLLIEESGTTDFAGALLRFFAAEGVCQGHVLHMVGVGEGWVKELPAVAEERAIERKTASSEEDRMKIAWRYERLGQTGERGALSFRPLMLCTLSYSCGWQSHSLVPLH